MYRILFAFVFLGLSSASPAQAARKKPRLPAQVVLTGTIERQGDAIRLDLAFGDSTVRYEAKGPVALQRRGFWRALPDYSRVMLVRRLVNARGKDAVRSYENKGELYFFPRQRYLAGINVPGLPVESHCFYRWGDSVFWLGGGQKKCGIDFEKKWLDRERLEVSLRSGELGLEGTLRFSEAALAKARVDLRAMKVSGQGIRFAGPKEAETEDDRAARELLSMFEVLAFDLMGM